MTGWLFSFIRFVLVSLLLFTLVGVCGGCVKGSQSTGFKTYTDSVKGYSFSYPGNWQKVEPDLLSAGEAVAFYEPGRGKGMPPFVSITAVPMTEMITLDDYLKSEMSIAAGDVNYTLMSKDDIVVNGVAAKRIIANYDHETMPATAMQAIMIYGNSAWLINCMCSPSIYNTYKPTFDRVINSFKFSGVSAAAQSKQSAYTEMLTYTDTANGLSVSYPRDWKEMPQNLLGGLMNIMGGKGTVAAGFWAPAAAEYGFTPNFIVARTALQYEQTLESAYNEVKLETEQEKGYAFISKDYLTIDGIPAIKYIYQSSQIANSIHVFIILVRGKTGWVILFSCAPQSFNSLEPTFDAIAGSLVTD